MYTHSIHAIMYIPTHIHTWAYTSVQLHAYIRYTFKNILTCMFTYLHTYVFTTVHTHIFTHLPMHIPTPIYS